MVDPYITIEYPLYTGTTFLHYYNYNSATLVFDIPPAKQKTIPRLAAIAVVLVHVL